jgi:hypothetical protein
MIIFGTRARHKTIKSGKFHCPHCQRERQYAHKQGRNYFALYFVPIFPVGGEEEFIECQSCRRTYAVDVLQYKPAAAPQVDAARLLTAVKERLEKGYSVEYVVSDLTAEGMDREVAASMVTVAVGPQRRVCPKCDLTYAPSVTACPDCTVSLPEPA